MAAALPGPEGPSETAASAPGKGDFPKRRRLLKSSDFKRVFQQGRRQSVPEFTLAYRVRPLKEGQVVPPRLGLSVSRKAGGSVQRNKLKRRLREIFRLNQEKLVPGAELVFVPRKEATALGYLELQRKIFGVLSRGKLLKKES
jgi:ribonuclease P protein component